LLTVWTLVAYGFLFAAAKHSPRYLVLLHPALALWAALALRPLLPAARALGLWVAAAAGLAWAVILLWPHPLHSGGTGAAVTALAPVLGPREAPLAGFRLKHEGTRARFAFYADREDVRTVDDPDALVRLGAGAPGEVADRHLDDAKAAPADARQELGRDHGPVGLELDAVEGRAAEELEGAVHVAHGQAEEGAHEEVPGGGVQPARERIGARVA